MISMATAKKTKSGKYSVLVFDKMDENNKRIYKRFTADTKKDAELLAAQYRIQKKHTGNMITVESALNEFISLRRSTLSPATIRGYISLQKNLLEKYPSFMKKYVSNVTENDLQGIISDLSTSHSPKTVKNYYALLRSISASFRDFNVSLPKVVPIERDIPTEDEITALMKLVADTELEIPCMLGAYCMMRRSEICALTMDDIDFKNKKIHIRKALVYDEDDNLVIKSTKTLKSYRTITVPDFVLDKIKKKGHITTHKPIHLTHYLERTLKANNMKHFRFHDLRHFAASVFHYKGVPMSYTQKYGGWSTMATLTKIYQHTLKDKEDEIFKTMNNYFENYATQNATLQATSLENKG